MMMQPQPSLDRDAVLAQDATGDFGRADHRQRLPETLAPQLIQANFLWSEQASH